MVVSISRFVRVIKNDDRNTKGDGLLTLCVVFFILGLARNSSSPHRKCERKHNERAVRDLIITWYPSEMFVKSLMATRFNF